MRDDRSGAGRGFHLLLVAALLGRAAEAERLAVDDGAVSGGGFPSAPAEGLARGHWLKKPPTDDLALSSSTVVEDAAAARSLTFCDDGGLIASALTAGPSAWVPLACVGMREAANVHRRRVEGYAS